MSAVATALVGSRVRAGIPPTAREKSDEDAETGDDDTDGQLERAQQTAKEVNQQVAYLVHSRINLISTFTRDDAVRMGKGYL